MRRISLAIVCSLAMTGFVLADEFTVAITKIDGNSVTYFKMGPAGEKGYLAKALRKTGDAITTAMSANVKVQRRITVDLVTYPVFLITPRVTSFTGYGLGATASSKTASRSNGPPHPGSLTSRASNTTACSPGSSAARAASIMSSTARARRGPPPGPARPTSPATPDELIHSPQEAPSAANTGLAACRRSDPAHDRCNLGPG